MGFGHTASIGDLSAAERGAPRKLLAVLLFVAVMMNQVSRVMIPSLLSTIKEDVSFGVDSDGSPMIAASLPAILPMTSMTCLFGKLALGTATDRLGGSIILVLVFALFAASSVGLVFTVSTTVFGAMWVFNSLAYTATWGAATQVIHSAFPKDEWPTQLSSIASAGRLGAAAGAIVFGFLLSQGLTWRQVFTVPAVVQVFLVFTCIWQHRTVAVLKQLSAAEDQAATAAPKAAEKAAGAPASGSAAGAGTGAPGVLAVLATLDFWLMFTAKCSLFVFTQWFMNFVGLYLRNSFGYSPAASTNAISVANAGQMVSLVMGGKYYKTLEPRQQCMAIACVLAVTAAIPALLLVRETLPLVNTLILPFLFVWGLCFAVPFYLPIGTYALECGGKHHGAFFTNLFDAGGFTSSSAWNLYAAEQSRHNSLQNVVKTLVVLGLLAAITLPLAMYRRLPKAKGKRE